MSKFIFTNLKYSDILLKFYFSISHIIHKVYLNYILINFYLFYNIVDNKHFINIITEKQNFLIVIY